MAISIKNHEDRITALEKNVVNFSTLEAIRLKGNIGSNLLCGTNPDVLISRGSSTFTSSGGKISLKAGTYFIMSSFYARRYATADGYVYLKLKSTAGLVDDYGGFVHNNFGSGGQTLVTITTFTQSDTIWVEYTESGAAFFNNQFMAVLKLYYNFSYNITREFYKVKFKLKHYLCSHLQKFI